MLLYYSLPFLLLFPTCTNTLYDSVVGNLSSYKIPSAIYCLFSLHICLFVWSFSSHSRIFQIFGDITIAEGLQIFTYARHLWPLSSEGFLTCRIHCDTGHPF